MGNLLFIYLLIKEELKMMKSKKVDQSKCKEKKIENKSNYSHLI